jgi:hypothetical protein
LLINIEEKNTVGPALKNSAEKTKDPDSAAAKQQALNLSRVTMLKNILAERRLNEVYSQLSSAILNI